MEPIEETDKQKLADMEISAKRQRRQLLGGLSILAVLLIFAVVALFVTNSNQNRATLQAANARTTHDLSIALTELRGSCAFYQLIGTLGVESRQIGSTPPTSKIGVQLVVASRIAYIKASCYPPLPKPSASLIYLAQKYDVEISG